MKRIYSLCSLLPIVSLWGCAGKTERGTATGGLIALLIENDPLYRPLVWGLIGGLIAGTLLSRTGTPVLYKLLPLRVEPKLVNEKLVLSRPQVPCWL